MPAPSRDSSGSSPSRPSYVPSRGASTLRLVGAILSLAGAALITLATQSTFSELRPIVPSLSPPILEAETFSINSGLNAKPSNVPVNFQDEEEPALNCAGPSSFCRAILGGTAPVESMVTGDFDEDGLPDLVVFYRTPSNTIIAFRRGNIDF